MWDWFFSSNLKFNSKKVRALTLRQGLGMGLDSKGKECQLGQEKPENKKGARGKAGLCGGGGDD